MDDPWESHAIWWQREFTEGADPEYVEQILPLIAEHLPSDGLLVDIGCGEGQVSRLAGAKGMAVVGLDPAHTQVAEAVSRLVDSDAPNAQSMYLQSGAAGMPIADASADAAVACLVFEHIADLDSALSEVARILRPGGRFLFLLNHPLLQTPGSGWIDDQILDPPEMYWRVGPYLDECDTIEEVEKDVFIRFFHRPLSRYLNSAIERGLRLERMIEPAPPPGFLGRTPEYSQVEAIPRLLFLRFEKA